MGVWLSFAGLGLLLFVLRRLGDRRLAVATGVEAAALEGAMQGVPAIASLSHLEPRRETTEVPASPYRRNEVAVARLGDAPHQRAKAALANARWLLMSAVDEALAADSAVDRGDRRGADLHRLAQTQAEAEALQCVFEAEECLGTRIVRELDEPRCVQRFYGQAARLLVEVSEYYERAFPRRAS